MNLLSLPFIILLTLSSVVAGFFGLVAFRARRTMPGGFTVSLIGLSVFIWSFGYLLEVLAPDLPSKIIWANLKQIGNVMLPTATIVFALRYAQFVKSVRKRLIALLFIEPVIVLYLFFIDNQVPFMRINPRIFELNGLSLLKFEFGEGLYLHFAYGAALTIAAAILLVLRLIRSESFYRQQISYILFGLSIPFLGAFLTIMGVLPPEFDTTPLLLGFSFPIMAFGLFRNQFFSLTPVNLASVLDHLPYGFMVLTIVDSEKIAAINPVAEKILQVNQANALGRSVKEFIPLWQFSPGADETNLDFQLEWKERIYQVNCYRTNKRSDPVINWLVFFHDLTEQILGENKLKASEEKYRLLAENASDVIWTVDMNGNFNYVSPSVEKLRGYTVEEVLQQSLDQALTPESIKKFNVAKENLLKIIAHDVPLDKLKRLTRNRFQLEQPCKNGSTVWTEVETSLLIDMNKKIIGIQGVSRDITESQKYEKELLAARSTAEIRSQEAHEALRREQQLHAITRTISSSMELDTILSDLLRQTLEITNSQETHLGLLTEDGMSIYFQYGMNLYESYLLDKKIQRDLDYLAWQIVDMRKGLILGSQEYVKFDQGFKEDFNIVGATGFMGVPVMSGLTVLGVLGVFSKDHQREFTTFDLAMMGINWKSSRDCDPECAFICGGESIGCYRSFNQTI